MAAGLQSLPPSDSLQEGVETNEKRKRTRTFNEQHTLDSDEEYEKESNDKQNRLDAKSTRQYSERQTILNDDGIKITPFNLREEMRTGHFDRDGTYVFKQRRRRGRMDDGLANDNDDEDDDDEVADAWLEGVDWDAIKARENDAVKAMKPTKRQLSADEADIDDEHPPGANQPNQSAPADAAEQSRMAVINDSANSPATPPANNAIPPRTILRKDGSKSKSSSHRIQWAATADEKDVSGLDDNAAVSETDRLALYKNIVSFMQPTETVTITIRRLGKEKSGKKDVASLTGFAGQLVDEGEYEVYEWTYEKLQHLISLGTSVAAAEAHVLAGAVAEPAFDMFGDDFEAAATSTPATAPAAASNAAANSSTDDKLVYWLYKWENTEAAATYGPFSSEQMQQWSDAGHFGAGVWVRRNDADKDAPFYTSRRVDFDLYT